MKWIALALFGSIGLIAFCVGLGWGWKHYQFSRHALEAPGVVVAWFDSTESTYPEVEFTDQRGEKQRFRGSIGSSPPDYAIGDRVKVWYDPEQPRQALIAEFTELWLAPLVTAGFGLAFLLAGIGSFFLVRSTDKAFGPAFQQRMARVRNMGLLKDEEGVRIAGRVRRIEALGDAGDHVLVCTGRLPDGREREFQSEPVCYRPGRELLGREVVIHIDPFDRERYVVDIRPLLARSASGEGQDLRR